MWSNITKLYFRFATNMDEAGAGGSGDPPFRSGDPDVRRRLRHEYRNLIADTQSKICTVSLYLLKKFHTLIDK